MRVAITGASGFLGTTLIDHLLTDGSQTVVAFTSRPDRLRDRYPEARGLVVRDSADATDARALESVDLLVHSAFPRTMNREHTAQGLRYASAVFAASKQASLTAVINISSQSVYDPQRSRPATELDSPVLQSPYSIAKYSTELLLEAYVDLGRRLDIRLGSLIGPGFGQRIVNKLVGAGMDSGRLTIQGGSQTYNLLDVTDAARAISAVIANRLWQQHATVNIGAEHDVSLSSLAGEVVSVLHDHGYPDVGIDHTADEPSKSSSALDSDLFVRSTGFRQTADLSASIAAIITHRQQSERREDIGTARARSSYIGDDSGRGSSDEATL